MCWQVELHGRMLRCDALRDHYLPVPVDLGALPMGHGHYDVTVWLRRARLAPGSTPAAQVVSIPSWMGRSCLYTDVTVRSGWRLRLATVHLESTGP